MFDIVEETCFCLNFKIKSLLIYHLKRLFIVVLCSVHQLYFSNIVDAHDFEFCCCCFFCYFFI